MEAYKLNHASPEVIEQQRIAEIKSLSYQERLKRMMALIKLSYMLRTAPKQQKK